MTIKSIEQSIQNHFTQLPNIWRFVIVFGTMLFLALSVNSYGADWQKDIIVDQANNSTARDYFYYYGIHFEKGFLDTQEFSGDEPINYLSDRVFYKNMDSLSFSEDVYIDKLGGDDYEDGKILLPRDLDNPKKVSERKLVSWTLPITCIDLGEGSYKVEHTIWVTLIDGIRKSQTLYTYFTCK